MTEDVRRAWRGLRARPGPMLVAILCLALGIGVNIVLFGTVDALLFRPPAGVSDAESLVRVRVGGGASLLTRGAGPAATYPQYERIAEERADLLQGLAAYGRASATRGRGTDAALVQVQVVTSSFFDVLGVRPLLGRFFAPEEGAPGSGAAVIVLSHRFWRQSFGGDADVLGRSVEANGVPLTVVGVAPEGFVGADLGDPDAWVPMGLVVLPEFGGRDLSAATGLWWLQLVGRLRPGVTVEQAVARTATPPVGDPFTPRPFTATSLDAPSIPVTLMPLRTTFFADQRGQNPVPAWALAVSAAVLLLACATVANLLLAQAAGRRREIAIRLALGGSPRRVARSQLVESALLASTALLAGAALARLGIRLVELLPVPPLGEVVTGRSLLVGTALTLLTPVLFGLAPALWVLRREAAEVLKEGGHGVTAASRLQRSFVVAQTGIGFVLVLVAGLFLRSLENARAPGLGMDVERVLVASPSRAGIFGGGDAGALADVALERVRSLPGVEAAGRGSIVPFYLFSRGPIRIVDGRADDEQPRSVLVNTVDPGYLDALGIGVTAGRTIDAGDRPDSPPVAIVSETLARVAWRGSSAIGSCLRLPRAFGEACVEVVGVATDARYEGPLDEPSPVLYLPAAQQPAGAQPSRFFVRAADGARTEVSAALRAELQAVDPEMPYVDVQPLEARLRPVLLRWEVGADLFTALGALAVLLASVGIHTVVSFGAARRTAELGVRAALGAGRARLLLGEVGRGLGLTAIGIAAGTPVALLVARAFASQLLGVRWIEPGTYAAAAALFAGLAVAASLRPAWRASGVSPASVLREE